MTGRDLSEKLNYLGMEKDIRKLALTEKMATQDEIALLSTVEVCDLVAEKFDIVFAESDCVGLVKEEDAAELYRLLKLIER